MNERSSVGPLQEHVIQPLKNRFVGREEVIDLIALAVVAGEHLFLFGPPGTAKSALIRAFSQQVQGHYFEYLLTRFSEPNEIFGPVDLIKLREGTVATVTTGMLPEAEFIFLDELFNANSAILNNLLTVLNERIYRRGAETHRLPMLSLFSASNHLPEDETLEALFDRFLLRCKVRPLEREQMPLLLRAGWQLEQQTFGPQSAITAQDLRQLSKRIFEVRLDPLMELYTQTIFRVRELGINLSDRRAVKILKLVAASALLCDRLEVQPSDLWVLRYVWDREEQIGPLSSLVEGILKQHPQQQSHPLAATTDRVEANEIAKQLDQLENRLAEDPRTLASLARLREQVQKLADQAAWVNDERIRKHLLERTKQLWNQIGK